MVVLFSILNKLYGAMEGGGENAVEPSGSITNAHYRWGHTARNGDWHYHTSHVGRENVDSDTQLDWAMDGVPICGPVSDDSILDECNGLYTKWGGL